MTEEIRHYQVGQKHRIVIEKAAGVKTGDGFKVETTDDNLEQAVVNAKLLYMDAKEIIASSIPAQAEQK